MSGFASADSATKQSQGNGITAEVIAVSGAVATEDLAPFAITRGDDVANHSFLHGHVTSPGRCGCAGVLPACQHH